jgi:nitrite reductase (NADH) large subunit
MTAQEKNIVELFDPNENQEAQSVEPMIQAASSEHSKKVIIIGSGPAGIRCAQEILKRAPQASIEVFGNEPFKPYNRVQLSSYLAGEVDRDQLDLQMPSESLYPNFRYTIATIKSVDAEKNCVIDSHDQLHEFDQLVFATGARAHVPNITGVAQTGVYTFRNLKDAEFLHARIASTRHVVVVGGGLLGLEAARALLRHNTKVTLIQQGSRLMNRQLDEEAAGLLQQQVEKLGIEVITQSGVRQIHSADQVVPGRSSVTGVTTYDGTEIACDTVVLCAGIKPNVELARSAKLQVAHGISVDDHLRTSQSNIFAIGECCEHRGQTYGLVNPGLEQASVVADVIVGGNATYLGSLTVSRLKVVGQSVCSMGEVAEADLPNTPFISEVSFRDDKEGVYRKVILLRGKILGAVGYGDWQELNRIQEAYRTRRTIFPWQLLTFRFTGRLWVSDEPNDVTAWPENAVVCQCNNISQGELVDAIDGGCDSLSALATETRAGSVCGSCKPLLSQLIAHQSEGEVSREKEKGWLPVFLASVIALCMAFLVSMTPEAQVATSVQQQGWFEGIWNDGFYKQVTGFSLLGLSVIGLLMSLRKRMGWQWMGQFAYWRVVHVLLGLLCVVTLVFHTGFHLGSNLNQLLMFNFLAIIVLGTAAGLIMSFSDKLNVMKVNRIRKFWNWLHILVTWPLPALLATHILSVYYF